MRTGYGEKGEVYLPDIVLVLLGAAVGGAAVWVWTGRRVREQLQAALAEASRRSARAVEWAKSEAAMQLERRDHEIAALRARLEEREHSVEQVRSRLEADLALAQRERVQWESRTAELSRRADELNAQVRGAAAESLRDLDRLRAIAGGLERALAEYLAALGAMEARVRAPAGPARPGVEPSHPEARSGPVRSPRSGPS